VFDEGTTETNDELEERCTRRKDAQTLGSRHTTRRFTVRCLVMRTVLLPNGFHLQKLERRLYIISFKIRATQNEPEQLILIWLEEVVKMLGTDGMSSEESGVDERLNTKYCKSTSWSGDGAISTDTSTMRDPSKRVLMHQQDQSRFPGFVTRERRLAVSLSRDCRPPCTIANG
jgi:hypothetical protein